MCRGIATFRVLTLLSACASLVPAALLLRKTPPRAMVCGARVAVPIPSPSFGFCSFTGEAWRLEALSPTHRLAGAELTGAHWRGVRLPGVEFWGVDFSDADLRDADLRGASLVRCGLYGADLRGADLGKANLGGTVYDRRTHWPAGFDPRAAGARVEE